MGILNFLKAEQLSRSKWRVLAIPFGGPFKGKDFDGEFFSPQTDIKPKWFTERPVIFHHGMDHTLKDQELGTQELEDDASGDGWWSTVWLNRSAQYWDQVNALLTAGKMFGSSGALSHLVRKNQKTGEILVWPHIEQTLTVTPANPFARVTTSKALSAFTNAGIALDPALSRVLADLDTSTTDLHSNLLGDGEAKADLSEGGDDVARARAAAIVSALRLRTRVDALRSI